MAIDFIRHPTPDIKDIRPKIDFYKPPVEAPINIEEKYKEEKEKLESEKAAFEAEKEKALSEEVKPKRKIFVRKEKVEDESL